MDKANPALFLDRDGVVNRERGEHTWRLEDFEVLPDVAVAVKAAHAAGMVVVVVTNQSGIGLGLYGHADVERLHVHLHGQLAVQGTDVDGIYYCPHHPSQGRCLCRKPGSLLLERAVARFGIDPARSLMVGDRQRDVDAAHAAGIRGVLVEANSSLLGTLENEGMIGCK
ncbi:MAG: HAD family hydrolase [Flavobacteriales bacterium]|nr:HAD family hydrolase [Flavobacteriales bacterium]MBP9080075.1 HAD family hydrolase [Flavobacteriales bacterium]